MILINPSLAHVGYYSLRLVDHTCVKTFDVMGGDKKKFKN
jgi:hypothetical protein